MDDTRDIVIETRTKVDGLTKTLGDFITESRAHRAAQNKRLDAHDALVNQAKGARWVVRMVYAAVTALVGGIAGIITQFVTHPNH